MDEFEECKTEKRRQSGHIKQCKDGQIGNTQL